MEKLGNRSLAQATDLEVIHYCQETGIDITFTKQHWPNERSKGPWTGQVIGADTDTGALPMAIVAFEKPTHHMASVNVSAGLHNLRTAIAHSYPNATKLADLVPRARAQKASHPRAAHRIVNWRGVGKQNYLAATAGSTTTDANGSAPAAPRTSEDRLRDVCDPHNFATSSNPQGANLMMYLATAQVCGMAREMGINSCFEDPEPKTQRAARMRRDWPLWEAAEHREWQTLLKLGCFEIVDKPKHWTDSTPLPLKYVYKLKIKDGDFAHPTYKARLVALGNLQLDEEFTCSYAPTARMFSLRTLCAIAAQEGLTLHKFDLTAAFVTSLIDVQDQYVSVPGLDIPDDKAVLLRKGLYGTRSAGALYHRDINKFLLDFGFTANSADPTLYRLQRGTSVLLMSLYVDDGAIGSNDAFLLKEFLDALSTKYDLSDKGELEWHLGIKIDHDLEAGTISLSQEAYVDSVLERFGMTDANTCATPMVPHTYLSKHDCPAEPDVKTVKYYQQLLGSLQYLACATRPDIAMAVNSCCQFLSNPGPTHVEAAKHILRYLKGTKGEGISYGNAAPGLENVLFGYVDADHAGDKDDRKSVGGYVMMLNNGPVSWSSKKIKVTALSSFESEWYSASICGCEVEALRRLLDDLGFTQTSPTVLYEDNSACIYACDPERPMNARSKHIDTRVYRLRDLVRDGVLQLVKIDTSQQMADGLTKALPAPAIAAFRRTMAGGQ